jgi:hypothetical protein
MSTSSAWYTDVHTSKHFPLGTIKQAVSGNRYIYGKGVASLAQYDAVFIDEAGVVTRAVTGASLVGRVAVAQAANTSTTNYSWYLASGSGFCAAATTVSDNKGLYITGTAGQVDDHCRDRWSGIRNERTARLTLNLMNRGAGFPSPSLLVSP